MTPSEMRVLVLCDSPVVRPGRAPTGFGRVARNILGAWHAQGMNIDVWALHFDGWDYDTVPYRLFPAGNAEWNSPERLTAFLNQLSHGNYTHVWMLMNVEAFHIPNLRTRDGQTTTFAKQFRKCCQQCKIRSVLYFPVDAPLESSWLEMIFAVDVAVSYTEYGKRQVAAAAPVEQIVPHIPVIPHGLDPIFRPVEEKERREFRKQLVLGRKQRTFASEKDFVILNVNKNEWRKDPLRTLEIVSQLIKRGVPAKLILRMAPLSSTGGIHLERAAAQLGLRLDQDWVYLPPQEEESLPKLYSVADLYLTTTMGEGWGLGITEALGCGTPVAVPDHTSCAEIAEEVMSRQPDGNVELITVEHGYVCGDDTRLRQRMHLAIAVDRIEKFYRENRPRIPLSQQNLEWLSWDRIAAEMLKVLKGER